MKKSNTFLTGVVFTALIFQLLTFDCTAQYTKLINFTGIANGSRPRGDLFSDGTFLYGMTSTGGTKDSGTVFKIMPDGTGYAKLLDFTFAKGWNPFGSLISDGNFLYGMTTSGGTNNSGVIFKIMPDGTGYAKLHDFGIDTYQPLGALISDGIFLYGMASGGGTNGGGVIFKIKPDGTGYSKLHDFGGSADGVEPRGSLISDGNFLYGMTNSGGTGNLGIIFKIKADGTGYAKLYDFIFGGVDGGQPCGSLISVGTYLYGMTSIGGTGNGGGVIFKIKPDGTGYAKLLNFNTINGYHPYGTLVTDGTFLYGMTEGSGSGMNAYGNIFRIKPDGTGYSRVLKFLGVINGKTPEGSIISDGNFLYGMTLAGGTGGTNTDGTVFKFNLLYANNVNQTPIVCAGYSVTIGTHTHISSGIYNDTLTSYQGCDSAVTTNLTVLPFNTFTQSPTVCAGQSLAVGSNIYSTSGNHSDILTSLVNGCDSTVTTNLTVLPANTFTQSPTVCAGNSIIVGAHNYTVSATYNDTITSFVNGCDSIVTTLLTINSVDTSVSVSNFTLTANATGAAYQWLNCNNGNTPIAGQTNQTFTATANGNYAVIVTHNSCSDTSSCYNITNIGIIENSIGSTATIYPNPFTSQTTITFMQEQKNTIIKIMDEMGKEVKSLNFTGKQLTIEKVEMLPGTYFLQLNTEQGRAVQKLIIQ